MPQKCEPGQIERIGYKKKAYKRRSYVRKDGIVVRASSVGQTSVPPVCIKDVGKPGKGPKTLPKLRDKLHLSKYGYAIHKPKNARRAALRAASKDFNTLEVLRRLNLIRNYQAVPENKAIFSKDVEYMKKLYAEKQKGGADDEDDEENDEENNMEDDVDADNDVDNDADNNTDNDLEVEIETATENENDTSESDDVVDNIDLPEKKETTSVFTENKVCNGECKSNISEVHSVNGKKIVYYTLGNDDTDQILKLDIEYMDPGQTRKDVVKKLNENQGFLVGIKIENELEGYCQYKPINDSDVDIVWFCANKGCATPLYIFMEKFFEYNDYTKIYVDVNLDDQDATRKINFWYAVGFMANKTKDKRIFMEKII